MVVGHYKPVQSVPLHIASSALPDALSLADCLFSNAEFPALVLRKYGNSFGDLKSVYANPQFFLNFGYEDLVVHQDSPAVLMRPESYDIQMEALYRALQDDLPVSLDVQLFTEQDIPRWVEMKLSPIVLPGTVGDSRVYWQCILHDVQRLKNVEHALWETVKSSQLQNITLQRALDREVLLRRFNTQSWGDNRPDVIVSSAATALCDALKAERCMVYLQEQHSNYFTLAAQHAAPTIPPMAQDTQLDAESPLITQFVHSESQVLKLEEVTHQGAYDISDLIGTAKPARSMLLGAIMDGHSVMGIIVMHHCGALRKWHGHEVLLVKTAGVELAKALQRSRMQTELLQARALAEQQAKVLTTALEKQKEINTLQSDFISMASHELRTPLAVIDGAVQLLMRTHHSGATSEQKEYTQKQLEKIRKSTQRMDGLVSDTLNLSRLETGQIEFHPLHFNLAQLTEDITHRLEELHRHIAFEIDLRTLPSHFWGDSKLIEQVLTNLIDNAVKYSSYNGKVSIVSEVNNSDLLIHVKDQGIGIPEAEVQNVCEKFFRASNTTGLVGTGIGLYLAQTIAGMHNGKISVESAYGKGSVFTILLPLRSDPHGTNTVY